MNYTIKQTITPADIRRIYLGQCSPSTFWRIRRRDKTFPKPFSFGSRLYWHVPDIETWYENLRNGGSYE